MFPFGIKKTDNNMCFDAEQAYDVILRESRKPVYYTTYKVADTFESRFDLLSALMSQQIFKFKRTLPLKEATYRTQILFDAMFKDMDYALRESGVSDLGVPKHMKRMMKAFHGRLHAYDEALLATEEDQSTKALEDALIRNLYGSKDIPDETALKKLALHIQDLKLV